MTTLRIDEIQVVDRHRKDLGDLSGLAESIRERALLHPPAVTPSGRLIAGARRLEACRSLGWTEIPVTVISSLSELRELLEAERDENTERLEMKPSEKVALGRALEELERPAREANRVANLPGQPKPENLRLGETREVVGAAVGMSGPTYQRAKSVVEAAETGDPVGVEALAAMDLTGKVTPAYERVIGRSINGRDIASPKPITRDGTHKRSPGGLIENLLRSLAGVPLALKEIDSATAIAAADAPLREWDKKLTTIIQALNSLRGDIREEIAK